DGLGASATGFARGEAAERQDFIRAVSRRQALGARPSGRPAAGRGALRRARATLLRVDGPPADEHASAPLELRASAPDPAPPSEESDSSDNDFDRPTRRQRRQRLRQAFGTKLLTTFAIVLTVA